MNFLSIDIPSALRNGKIFFAIMIASWISILLIALSEPFSLTKSQPAIGAAMPGIFLIIVYFAGYVSPFVASIYGWVLTFSQVSKGVRVYGLVSAVLASALSVYIIITAVS
jgi:hypothetical protein